MKVQWVHVRFWWQFPRVLQSLVLPECIAKVSAVVIKHLNKSNLGRKGIIISGFITWGCESTNSAQNPAGGYWRSHGGILFAGLLLAACSVCLFIELRDAWAGLVSPQIFYTISRKLCIKKMPLRLTDRPIWYGAVFQLRCSLPKWLCCVASWQNTNQDSVSHLSSWCFLNPMRFVTQMLRLRLNRLFLLCTEIFLLADWSIFNDTG